MRAFFLIGLQGSGKGVQGTLLTQIGFKQLVASKALESAPTDVKDEITSLVSAGQLVPDEITVRALTEYLEDKTTPSDDIVLDGYMRTPGQTDAMLTYLEKMGYDITVFVLVLPDEIAVRRALLRNRADDTPEKLKVRFKGYYDHIGSVLATVVRRGYSVHTVDTSGYPEHIFQSICKIARL
ncbi:MAG: nucleoside monophosphate kinase [Candidatus Zambryskibacteria bacterium]|nr:nucleoside monophosphate kinase [Candidatus Zambryskibacteria bacterium]